MKQGSAIASNKLFSKHWFELVHNDKIFDSSIFCSFPVVTQWGSMFFDSGRTHVFGAAWKSTWIIVEHMHGMIQIVVTTDVDFLYFVCDEIHSLTDYSSHGSTHKKLTGVIWIQSFSFRGGFYVLNIYDSIALRERQNTLNQKLICTNKHCPRRIYCPNN